MQELDSIRSAIAARQPSGQQPFMEKVEEGIEGEDSSLNHQVSAFSERLEWELEKISGEKSREDRAFSALRDELAMEKRTIVKPLLRRFAGFLRRLYLWSPAIVKKVIRRLVLLLPSRLLTSILARSQASNHGGAGYVAATLLDYGVLLKAKRAYAGKADILVLPVIDWNFRTQRPQHIPLALARRGHRVFYFTTTFEMNDRGRHYSIVSHPDPNVFIVKLHCSDPFTRIYEDIPDDRLALELAGAISVMFADLNIRDNVSIVHLPFWRRIANRIPGSTLVYDCMDYHAGFATNSTRMLKEEDALVEEADVVTVTSSKLEEVVSAIRPCHLIRNGAEVEHFAERPENLYLKEQVNPVIGYFGAISDWFDMPLIAELSARHPEWTFLLVGSTAGCDEKRLPKGDNVIFTGEVTYDELPAILHSFDVCVIPFVINDLTRATNPVKVYEYLSAGKPVVATRLPELELMRDLVYLADGVDGFEDAVGTALKEAREPELVSKRKAFAEENTWLSRADEFDAVIAQYKPKVSVIVLCYNNLEMTKACLHSLQEHSLYDNLELIIVDNASQDDTPEFLRDYQKKHPEYKVILNDDNLGFAAGNNVGMEVATGDYIVLLNNDTYVTAGWVNDLVRHFRLDPELGLVGPVTNNIGNEAKIEVQYESMQEMAIRSRAYTMAHPHERIYVNTVAFFCVAMPRRVYEEIGGLDEDFGQGFFEDDDYCRRVKQAGYKIAIADDVFIHHHLSASFNKLKAEKRQELFERNKKIYESKWGKWRPHEYRR